MSNAQQPEFGEQKRSSLYMGRSGNQNCKVHDDEINKTPKTDPLQRAIQSTSRTDSKVVAYNKDHTVSESRCNIREDVLIDSDSGKADDMWVNFSAPNLTSSST